MEPKVITPVVKGVILSLILIVYGIAIYLTGQMGNKALSYIPYLILLGGIAGSGIIYANQMKGNVTFGNVFAHGFKTVAVIIVISAIYTALSIKVIFPEIADIAATETRKALEKQGNMSEEQIEQAVGMTSKFLMPFAIGAIIIGYGIVGAIGAAIGAAAAKKNPVSPFNQP